MTWRRPLARYHDWDQRLPSNGTHGTDPRALGRFYRHAVVVAGPGFGKSTLLSRVAGAYAADGFAVLKASALKVLRRIKEGQGFENALFEEALVGAQITRQEAHAAGISDWVVLLDGLDEAGIGQGQIIEGLRRFKAGYPTARIVVTTRPVGYQRAHLADWRHYDIPGIAEGDVEKALVELLRWVLSPTDPRLPHVHELVKAAMRKSGVAKRVMRTPLMVGLGGHSSRRGLAWKDRAPPSIDSP